MNDARIAAIRERLASRTPGEWKHETLWTGHQADDVEHLVATGNHEAIAIARWIENRVVDGLHPHDAEFIAHAPQDIEYLLSLLSPPQREGDGERLQ